MHLLSLGNFQDGGDPAVEVSPRDIVYTMDLHAEKKEPRQLAATNLRCGGVVWGNDDLALVSYLERKIKHVAAWK